MQLEEKRIPYKIDKINMRCYGDKKASFTAKVPSGMLPVLEIDSKLMTEVRLFFTFVLFISACIYGQLKRLKSCFIHRAP